MRLQETYISGLGVYLPETVSVERRSSTRPVPRSRRRSQPANRRSNRRRHTSTRDGTARSTGRIQNAPVKNPEEISLLLYADAWHQGPQTAGNPSTTCNDTWSAARSCR